MDKNTFNRPWTNPPAELKTATPVQWLAYIIASGFGTGHLPASGTWGALLAWGLHSFLFPNAFTLEHWLLGVLLLIAVTIIGIWSAEVTERMTGVKDDRRVTIDEVAGYFLAVLFVPAGLEYTIPALALARIFDVLKPPPANKLQDLHGGIGIMIDDLIASVYAVLVMHALVFVGFPQWISGLWAS
jgi:phosphatidylglycerophosphatase A